MVAKGIDMEALSPRDANAQRPQQKANDLKTRATAQLKANKEKEHPPPPPPNVTEPPSPDCKDGVVYQVGKLLGKGGFAVCYEGTPAGSRNKFALKIVKSQMPPKMEQKFQTELQIHSKMRQENIVQFHRAFSFESATYLVLELCPNGSLMDMVKRRKGVTEAEVRFYSVQIAGAIKYMHSKGIIHRDLKMGNIFLDKHMNAKIGDFGLAALLVTGRDMQTIRRTTLCGTPNYIAPEILEKGRKGHDHMVDIWSLGIIMFAMLTSKPPFQSTTTDEIYRRARDRDYDWPAPENSNKIISQEAKDLVASMLQDADRRPYPDDIVQHSFFGAGYMPVQADMTPRLREAPPDRDCFYNYPRTELEDEINLQNLKEMCVACGVGPWKDKQVLHRPIWKEMAGEEQAGLTPVIPLAEGIVYRPFDEWAKEAKLQGRYAVRQAHQLPHSSSYFGPTVTRLEGDASAQRPPSSSTLRAHPQSFAAQQRAQSKPTRSVVAAAAAGADSAVAPAAGAVTGRGRELLPERPALTRQSSTTGRNTRARREAAAAAAEAGAEALTATTTATVALTGEGQSVEAREQTRSVRTATTRSARAQLPPSRTEPGLQKAETNSVAAVTASLEALSVGTTQKAHTLAPTHATVSEQTAAQAQVPPAARRGKQTAGGEEAAASPSPRGEMGSLFGPDEFQEQVPGTRPDFVLARLRKLQAELERALNARSMALVSARDRTPSPPQIVVKWVDYTNKFGLGYILNDGAIGCILRSIPTSDAQSKAPITLPPACILIHDAERHIRRKNDRAYADRHQIVPMTGGIYFYENYAEDGISRVRVDPAAFRIALGVDGVPHKLSAGRDVFDHRKRERVVLWKKFANYMLAFGRELESESELAAATAAAAAAQRPLGGTGGDSAPTDVVTFYQRFGDVGCWMFADGHMQFNFPDHTKLVLDATGTYCHFWHLPQDAAERLAVTGTLDEAALDERAVLSYPVQTLLNFSVPSKATLRSVGGGSSAAAGPGRSARHRPDISPDLQGVPAANDFRRKIEFIKNVVREWVANGGIGNSDMSSKGRLRWLGHRETRIATIPAKHVWVTIGARGGDSRFVANFDPRRPQVVFPDQP